MNNPHLPSLQRKTTRFTASTVKKTDEDHYKKKVILESNHGSAQGYSNHSDQPTSCSQLLTVWI